MKPTLIALVFSAAVWSQVWAQAPGDARRGGVILREADCLNCHTFQGAGKGTAPDLGHRAGEVFTRPQMAALMWNHAPAMWAAMHNSGTAVPGLTTQSVGDLFSYFYATRFFEPLGDAGRGKEVFQNRRCATCHNLTGPKIGPPLAEWKEVSDPAAWIRQMWNHSGAMYAKTLEKKIPWPNLTGQELSDLLVYLRSLPQTRSAEARFTVSDPEIGKTLFDSKGCTNCHVVKGSAPGKISIPIAGKPADSLSTVAAAMWNHAPMMNARTKGDLPRFEGQEMNHVLGYLFWAGFFEDAGDPAAGLRVYEKKQCGDCHEKGEAGAPSVATIRSRPGGATAITMTSALWRHGPNMLAAMRQRGRQWPLFTPTEMSDLIAYFNRRD